jgi:thiamine-phosphate pyrophosphorylase
MINSEKRKLYIVSPAELEIERFSEDLKLILDTVEVSCFRLALSTFDENIIARVADMTRYICHSRDVAIVIEDHFLFVKKHGLDGVHLSDGPRNVRKVRKDLGKELIVGAFCGNSKHNGITAGEAGADYVSFGPLSKTILKDGSIANPDLFAWWSKIIEIPVIAEGGLNKKVINNVKNVTDFLAFGDELWRANNPLSELNQLLSSLE